MRPCINMKILECNVNTTFKSKSSEMKNLQSVASSGRSTEEDINDGDEATKMAIASFQAREEEIERKKMQVRERVQSQITRRGEETKRLAQVWEELAMLTDPVRKEVVIARKRVDVANRELKSLGQICQKKEKEYKEVMEVFHEKNKERAQMTATLVELVEQSEKFRMKKLEELNKIVNTNA